MRVVLDTNVLVSALIRDGKPRALLHRLFDDGHSVIISREIVEEFSRVVADRRIRRYVTAYEAAVFLRALISRGKAVRLKSRFRLLGSADDYILRTATDGHAELIVTGDAHLLALASFRGIKIRSVAETLVLLTRSND
jgi:putative PIN family toxin of toxin-antitoxin system